jgi:uncharacterized membrane protein YesL
MAKTIKRKPGKPAKRVTIGSPFKIYWEKTNYIFFLTGLVLLLIGFYLMTIGPWDSNASLVVSPIILFIAYIIIFPLAIFFRRGVTAVNEENKDVISES